MDELIFDRTQADVDYWKILHEKGYQKFSDAEKEIWKRSLKGAWNLSDATRVSDWTEFLYNRLMGYGYGIVHHPTTWADYEIISQDKMDELRHGIDALRNDYFSVPDWHTILYVDTLDYAQANAYEWDLQQVYNYSAEMIKGLLLKESDTIFMQAGGILNA